MKILHTADWHVAEHLAGIDRQPDITARVQEIAQLLDIHQVDVLLIAGDLFSQCNRMQDVDRAMRDICPYLRPFLSRGGTIVVVCGNHDNEHFFAVLRSFLDLASPLPDAQIHQGPRPPGRLYLAAHPLVLELADPAGLSVQFVLLPYPTSHRYLRDENTHYQSLMEKHRLLHDHVISRLQYLQQQVLNTQKRSVLAAHLHIRGSQLNSFYHASESDEVLFDPQDLPSCWDYIALGHIHKPQSLQDLPWVRYAGSIERFNAGEKTDEKSVTIVDIGPEGRRGEIIVEPLHATPFLQVDICDPEQDIPRYAQQWAAIAQHALVSCHLFSTPGVRDVNRVVADIRRAFPRCYELQIDTQTILEPLDETYPDIASEHVAQTVETYLQEKLRQHPLREEVVQLAHRLMARMEEEGVSV